MYDARNLTVFTPGGGKIPTGKSQILLVVSLLDYCFWYWIVTSTTFQQDKVKLLFVCLFAFVCFSHQTSSRIVGLEIDVTEISLEYCYPPGQWIRLGWSLQGVLS